MDRDKYFIRTGKILTEVTQEVYKTYYSERRREKTLTEKDARNKLVYYNAWDGDGLVGAELVTDRGARTDEIAERRLMAEKLYKCLARLNEEERGLIRALFVYERTVTDCARELGVPRRTLTDRRDRVLQKLRRLMEAPDRRL